MMRSGRRRPLVLLALCLAVLAGLIVLPRGSAATGDAHTVPGMRTQSRPRSSAPLQVLAFPPSPGARFDSITTEDGLSQNTVSCILQDSRGFMWFGTTDGLNKYDGYSFTVYRHVPDDPSSLRDDNITALYEDRSGVLWLGTQAGWLERLDGESQAGQGVHFTHYQFDLPVVGLQQDASGTFWVATTVALFRFDPESEESSIVWNGEGIASSLEPGPDGNMWLGVGDGWLYVYDRAEERVIPVPITVPLENYAVTSLHADERGSLWIGRGGGGLSRLDLDSGQFSHYRHDANNPDSLVDDCVCTVYGDRSDAVWIGTCCSGLDRLDPETGRFTHFQNIPGDPRSLSDDTVLSIYQDRSDVLWVGTLTGGLNKLDLARPGFEYYRSNPGDPNSLGDDVVLAFHQDREGMLWIGTRNGLDRFDPETGQWRHYRHDPEDDNSLSHDVVWSLFEDSSGEFWLGTQLALDNFDRDREQFVHHPIAGYSLRFRDVPVKSIGEDPTGALWVASDDGLYRFNRETGRYNPIVAALWRPFSYYYLAMGYDDWRVTLLRDRMGVLWIGTYGQGLYRYDDEQLKLYEADAADPESLSSNQVSSILEDTSGVLWIGTGAGLDRFERSTETFAHYRVEDGLPSDEIRAILEDDVPPERGGPYLWISTLNGLSRFDPRTGTFRNYDVADGLQSNEFNPGAAFKSSDGTLFFGGINGFNAFDPQQIASNPHVPPVMITAFSLFNEVVRTDLTPDEQLVLSYQENFVSFDFAALAYNAPEKNQYAYKMEGVDGDWVYAGTRRRAEYTDLQPGDYVFRVRGSNNHGVWNEEGAAVHLTITPPFWERWWFRGLIALFLMAVAVGAYRLRVHSIEGRSRELEEQVEERTAELQREIVQRTRVEEALRRSEREKGVAAERSRLARELHDSVTQSLFAVTMYADAVSLSLSSGQGEMVGEDVEKLRRTAREALGEMRLLVFELRPPILEEKGLVAALQTRLEAVERRAGLKTDLQIDGTCRLVPNIEEALYGIALEALNNTLRHAQAGKVAVTLGLEARNCVLEIVDDGQGFDPATTPDRGGLGLRGMAERAQEIGAQLTIDSQPGQGTRVTVLWSSEERPEAADKE